LTCGDPTNPPENQTACERDAECNYGEGEPGFMRPLRGKTKSKDLGELVKEFLSVYCLKPADARG